MSASKDYVAQLNALETYYNALEPKLTAADEPDGERLITLLKDVCTVVRNADKSSAPKLDAVLEKAATLIDRGIYLGYDGANVWDFMPSFAHEPATLFQDSLKGQFSECMRSFVMSTLNEPACE